MMGNGKQLNCLLAGVGGQGTILASKLIACAYMKKGYFARTAETIGMAQRGGCVASHVRIGEAAYSPMIPRGTADLLIGFEPAEAVRCLPFLKREGVVVVSRSFLKPVTEALSDTFYDGEAMLDCLKERAPGTIVVDTGAICRECGNPRVLNMALLGAAVAGGGLAGLSLDELKEGVAERVDSRYLAVNRLALEKGAAYAQ